MSYTLFGTLSGTNIESFDYAKKTDLSSKINRNGDTMIGALNMGSNKITSTYKPENNEDLINKAYTDDNCLLLSGGIMAGQLSMGTNKITSTYKPENNEDVVNKDYIDHNYLSLLGGRMTGRLNMGDKKIINLAMPTNSNDAVPKKYSDLNLLLSGGTMTGDINMNSKKIMNLGDPTDEKDVATKNYVDTKYDGVNIDIGHQSLKKLAQGMGNIAVGPFALTGMRIGGANVVIGDGALSKLTSGNRNVIIGAQAGNNYTESESNNIIIGHSISGTTGEFNCTRIGNDLTGKCFITGIYNNTSGGGVPVIINSSHELGIASSSRRFKENIIVAKEYDISKFRVVNFNYKKDKTQQIGLIAEEVADLYPELIVCDENNDPYTVKYIDMIPILIQTVQQLEHRIKHLERNNIT